MKWLIVGDIHGEFRAINYNLNRIEGKVDYDLIIQLGDFGFWKDALQRSKKKFPEMCKKPIYFIRGNHEEYSRYKRGKQRGPFFNDYEGIIVPNYFDKCKNIPRYINDEMVEMDGLKVLGVGGAKSMDREFRILGYGWWREEEVNKENVESIIRDNLKPDIILSHDAPTQFFKRSEYKGRFANRAGDKYLGKLYAQIKPRYWFFGHFHTHMEWKDDESGTKFVGFPSYNKGYRVFDTELMVLERGNW